MNSLVLGFFFLVGMAWALCECCVTAGNGNWMPLIVFLVVFLLAFSILGCLDVSDGMTNMVGAVTAIIMGLALLAFSIGSFQSNVGIGVIKLVSSIGFVITGFISLIPKKSSHSH